ncbi:MAG: PadR family transcriptional regulator [Oscillospiraceae bacterium]|nr:PadR family transcriptional regulator [Oscillospiraceae bacterium]
MKVDKSLLSGSTTMLILRLLEKEDMYGYKMIEILEKQSGNVFTLKAGTLYPILHGLQKQGMVESYDEAEPESARTRKYYSITKSGIKFLQDKKEEWTVYSGAVNAVLDFILLTEGV